MVPDVMVRGRGNGATDCGRIRNGINLRVSGAQRSLARGGHDGRTFGYAELIRDNLTRINQGFSS
jgi:hypothetical protein